MEEVYMTGSNLAATSVPELSAARLSLDWTDQTYTRTGKVRELGGQCIVESRTGKLGRLQSGLGRRCPPGQIIDATKTRKFLSIVFAFILA